MALTLPASTALSSPIATEGFVLIGTGLGIRSIALAIATGTGFSPASAALAWRFFFLVLPAPDLLPPQLLSPPLANPLVTRAPNDQAWQW
jgi:hypothetical protein